MNVKNKTKRKYLIISVVVLVVLSLILIFKLIEKRKESNKLSDNDSLQTVVNNDLTNQKIDPLSDILERIANNTNLIGLKPMVKDGNFYDIHWINNNLRFMRYPDFSTKLYKDYKNKDSLLNDYEKIKSVLKSLGFSIDSTRKTIDTSDGGSWSIVDDFWTNGKEYITINGTEFESSIVDDMMAELTISDLGTVKEVVSFENGIRKFLNIYITDFVKMNNIKSSERNGYAKGVFVEVSIDNKIPILFTYYPNENNKNIKRQIVIISHQAGDDGFIYYEENEKTGNTNLIFTSSSSCSCNYLKTKNISKIEAKDLLDILENNEYEWGGRRFFDKQIEDLNLDKCILNN